LKFLPSGKEAISLGVTGAGAAFSTTVLGLVKQFVPAIGIGDDILTALVGYLGYANTSGMVKDFFAGVTIAGVSQLVAGVVPSVSGTIHTVNPSQKEPNPTSTTPNMRFVGASNFGAP